jgi:hypothetical protein
MTHIRKLALALFLGLLCSSYSNSQSIDPVTGNLINYGTSPTETTSTWNNGVYVNQLCFGAGQPGNCGPNPSIREGNNINFSYGTVNLNQIVNINKALSIGGSGVQLSGFNFGFMAKNGNGWDDGRQDYLSAYVKFYNSAGSLASTYDYTAQTNQKYNWTLFNFSETFASPVAASTYGNAQVGFVGRDNNFWAGTYGPEIYNVNFSLKYSVRPDPCIADPLSSPTCPGYALATVKNSILGSTVSNASVTSFVPTINYALVSPGPAAGPALGPAAGPDPTNLGPQGPQGPQGPMGSQGPQGPAAGPQGQGPNQNSGGPMDSLSQPGPQGPQQGPAAGPQPAGGPPQQAQSAPPPSSGPSQAGPARSNDGPKMTPGAALSVARTAQEKDKAVQATAVQTATRAFENAMQSSQTASNTAIAMNQDMSASSATAAAQFASQTTQSSQQISSQAQQINNTGQTYSGTGLSIAKVNTNVFNIDNLNSSSTGQTSGQLSSVTQFRNESKTFEIEQPQMQVASFGGLGRAGNPLSDIMNQRMDMLQTNIEQRADSVKKNVQPNDLAGGTDVAAMAQIPKGYEAYSLVVLRDVPFYKPETIYKNQTTVDNARVFRGLSGGSDAKHQRMVDSQYQLGN